ncbi:MAG: ABC transporter ATP-binding protein [Microthrixaceae bacterium]
MTLPEERPADFEGANVRSAQLKVEGVAKTFDGTTPVLAGVDLQVASGSTVSLLGPSGCGKTTLLRSIAGLEVPDRGSIELEGRVLSGPDDFIAPESRRIGMVFQDWALFPHLSVGKNVGFGLPRSDRKDSSRIREALELVGLQGMEDRSPATLSGGQQQRVALARALAPRPAMLLLDEPFSNLDASLRGQVRGEVHRLLTDLGVTTIFVTHDQDEAFVLGDSVAVMSAGRIVQVGTPEQIYQQPVTPWVAGFVGDANFVSGLSNGNVAETILGRLEIERSLSGPVEVLIRPEDLTIKPGSGQSFLGTVTLVEYLGHATRYLVDCGGVSLAVRRQSTPILKRGESAEVQCVAERPLVAFPVT